MKWYSVELSDKQEISLLKVFLKGAGLRFESSGCYNNVHFEVEASEIDMQRVLNFLEEM